MIVAQQANGKEKRDYVDIFDVTESDSGSGLRAYMGTVHIDLFYETDAWVMLNEGLAVGVSLSVDKDWLIDVQDLNEQYQVDMTAGDWQEHFQEGF